MFIEKFYLVSKKKHYFFFLTHKYNNLLWKIFHSKIDYFYYCLYSRFNALMQLL